jgi:hypothetical protein
MEVRSLVVVSVARIKHGDLVAHKAGCRVLWLPRRDAGPARPGNICRLLGISGLDRSDARPHKALKQLV